MLFVQLNSIHPICIIRYSDRRAGNEIESGGKLKKQNVYLLAVLLMVSLNGIIFAQNAPIDFEAGGNGVTWTWTVFENDTNPLLEIIPNPDASGINTSATVAKFTALQAGEPYAGCESQHGADIGSFSFDVTNSTVKIMVWKSVISDVGLKFAEASSDAQPEVKVANTLTNQWEELTFDLSGSIGAGANGIIDQIIIFPDFQARDSTNIVYFDNITFSGQIISGPTVAAPTPTIDPSNVISIFSNAYNNVEGTDFNPFWNQTTVTTDIIIEGNNTLKYGGLDYQGTQFGSVIDVSGMSYLHVDYWTEDATALQVFLISVGSGEKAYDFTITTDKWNSVDIPLNIFIDQGLSLNDIHQFKFVGNGTVYLDNYYFTKTITSVEEVIGAVPNEYELDQNYPNPFNPTTKISFSLIRSQSVSLKVYDMLGQEVTTLLNGFMNAGKYELTFDAQDLPAGTYVYKIKAGNFNSAKKMMLIK